MRDPIGLDHDGDEKAGLAVGILLHQRPRCLRILGVDQEKISGRFAIGAEQRSRENDAVAHALDEARVPVAEGRAGRRGARAEQAVVTLSRPP